NGEVRGGSGVRPGHRLHLVRRKRTRHRSARARLCGRQQKLLVPPPGRSIPRRSSRRSAIRSARAEDYPREIMKIDNFFAELKRRNVYKVAVAYAIVGWLLVQIATQVFPFLEIPNWAIRLIIL